MKNKGFTLVELLAIIVILAVIMVIAVPKILDVVNGSRNSAWSDSVNMISKSIKNSTQVLDPETGNYKYTISGLCSNPSKLKEIVKLEDTTVTCTDNTFVLTGIGQFAGKSATITCTNTKCSVEILKDMDSNTPIKKEAGFYDGNNKLIMGYSDFEKKYGINISDDKDGGYYRKDNDTWSDSSGKSIEYDSIPNDVILKLLMGDEFSNVEKLVLPEGLEKIGSYVFYGQNKLKDIIIPSTVKSIGEAAFSRTSIQKMNVPSGIKKIEHLVFANCKELSELTLPSDLIELSTMAIYNCDKLTKLDLPNTLEIIGSQALASCDGLKNISLPASLSDIDGNAFSGKRVETITIDKNNNNFVVENNIIFSKDKTKLVLYPDSKAEETYTVPSSVKVIGKRAFYMTPLKSVVLPEGLVELEEAAFGLSSSITDIVIPSSVVKIGSSCFSIVNNQSKTIKFKNPNGCHGSVTSYDMDTGTLVAKPYDVSASELADPQKAFQLYVKLNLNEMVRTD